MKAFRFDIKRGFGWGDAVILATSIEKAQNEARKYKRFVISSCKQDGFAEEYADIDYIESLDGQATLL